MFESSCSVTGPPPGIVAAWPSSFTSSPDVLHSTSSCGDARQRSWGSILTALRSFHPTGGCFPLPWLRSHVPLSLAPPATFSVFATVVADPSWLWRARADRLSELRLLGFSPAGQPFSCIGAAPPRLGYEGPLRSTNRFCPGLLLFRASRPSNPGSPLLGSYPLVGFVFAAVGDFAQCVTCFHHVAPPIPPTARRRPSAF
jgi:hypothetical protein